MASQSDLLYLRTAIEHAAKGIYTTTPNPRVGCLVVRDGEVLGRGYHVRPGEGHAEVNALADAGRPVVGATAYVSLEPCAFEGRTPPCAKALIEARVERVVAAMIDPHPKVSGQGMAMLRAAGILAELVELPEAQALNAGYVSRVTTGRPYVRLKTAISLDGRTGMASGESQWITGEAARADVQEWRARSCALISGSGTVMADDARLTVRDERFSVDGVIRQPLRAIADSKLQLPSSAAVLQPPGEVLIVHAGINAPTVEGVEHICLPGSGVPPKVDLAALLDELGARGCNEVLVEAGAALLGAFLDADLWDELLVYMAPKLLGSDARPLANLPLDKMNEAVQARLIDCVPVGDDLRLRLGRSGQ
ncbi:MAG: riboflavin biosynthesis protein RibD [Gammaproteobacteria bacterium]|nr:riboflavin biosynthesis protein RibD [Gammaproteobacteria bacterium]|tara:strand:+ start:3033 stop:4127 length:1095 start_codon:yes stop_codon:yes gene_type:complete